MIRFVSIVVKSVPYWPTTQVGCYKLKKKISLKMCALNKFLIVITINNG